jgi:DNA-3-methyladenine glycosylase II
MNPPRITSKAQLAREVAALLALDPTLRTVYNAIGVPSLRKRPTGFGAVLTAIVSQQVSTAAATASMNKMRKAGLTTPKRILAASPAELRAAGLSQQKARYAYALAEAYVPWRALGRQSTDEVVTTLTQVTGIGPWTAEIYCLFSLGHADAFAPGDLALQIATQEIYGLSTRPSERELRAFSERWSPHRGAAARLLWDYYVHILTAPTPSPR